MPTWTSSCAARPIWTASATRSPSRRFRSSLPRVGPSASPRTTRPCDATTGATACARGFR
eukprot:4961388-Lingulodinium_polyedra.AAC.1